jgi:hypothetical protein
LVLFFTRTRVAELAAKEWRMGLTADDKQWILEQLERMETKLLTEFHRFASPVGLRVHSHAAVIRALVAAGLTSPSKKR